MENTIYTDILLLRCNNPVPEVTKYMYHTAFTDILLLWLYQY